MALSRILGLVTLAATIAGCSDSSSDGGNDQEATGAQTTGTGWQTLGTGVAYKKLGDGKSVFIAYGGYTAQLAWSEAWATELFRAKLGDLGVGHVYAVQGPRDASYAAHEIGNSKLRAHLTGDIADAASFVLVAAHSSGSFVAHELLGQLKNGGDDATLGKTVYVNLDGGGSGFSTEIAASLRRVEFAYAEDHGLSHNAGAAQAMASQYKKYGKSFDVKVTGSGCRAAWCRHDLLITHRPHNPDHYDLARDYTDFDGRPVTTEWIDGVSSYLGADDTDSAPSDDGTQPPDGGTDPNGDPTTDDPNAETQNI